MDRRVRDVVTKSFRCKGVERLDEDAETILTEAFKDDDVDAETIFTEAFTTTDLNTLDENNSPFVSRHRGGPPPPNNTTMLGENKNTTNSGRPTPRQSFKDKFVQMKKQQQFKPPSEQQQQQRKPMNLSVDASGAAEQYEAARRQRQERERFLQKMADNNKKHNVVKQAPSESPLAPQRQPIDP